MGSISEEMIGKQLEKWKPLLSLSDWDIRPVVVERQWRKSGDVKIDESNRMAAVMIRHDLDPVHLQEVVVHELVHIKLWDMDQMLETALNALYGDDPDEGKRDFVQGQFMDRLETTTQDITRALLTANGCTGEFMFDRVSKQITEELEE
jgi:hypothetical protein